MCVYLCERERVVTMIHELGTQVSCWHTLDEKAQSSNMVNSIDCVQHREAPAIKMLNSVFSDGATFFKTLGSGDGWGTWSN